MIFSCRIYCSVGAGAGSGHSHYSELSIEVVLYRPLFSAISPLPIASLARLSFRLVGDSNYARPINNQMSCRLRNAWFIHEGLSWP